MDTQILKEDLPAGEEKIAESSAGVDILTVEVFESFDLPEPIRRKWDDFMEAVGGEIFLTYDWCRIWWKHYGGGRDLKIFIFHQGEDIAAILPLFFDNVRLGPVRARVCKIAGTDFTPIALSIPIKKDSISRVVRKLSELMVDYPCDILHIGPVAGLYGDFDLLRRACEKSFAGNFKTLVKVSNVQTYFKIARNWTAQMQALTRTKRRGITRNLKSVDEVGTLETFEASESNFAEFFDGFVAMHTNRWNNEGKAGHIREWPGAYEFHCEVARTQLAPGRLRLQKVSIDDICIGYHYCYRFGERYFKYLNARAELEDIELKFPHISIGIVIFAENLKKALKENVKWIDAMQGRYEHKLRLGGELFPVKNIYLYRKSFSGSIKSRMFMALAWLINKFYYKAWHSRIAPKLRLRPKRLWGKWIRTYSFSLLRQ